MRKSLLLTIGAVSMLGVCLVTVQQNKAVVLPVKNYSIQGTVVKKAAGPVSGARVAVESGPSGTRPVATTNAEGAFTLENLPPGAYGITASANGLKPSHQVIQVSSANVTGVEFVLFPVS